MTRAAITAPRKAYLAEHGGPRTCLGCDKSFMSDDAGNRICPRCTARNANVGTPGGRLRATVPDPPDEDDWR